MKKTDTTIAWLLGLSLITLSCRTGSVGHTEDTRRIYRGLQTQIPAVDFKRAQIWDVVMFLDEVVVARFPGERLNHMIVDLDWPTNQTRWLRYPVTYAGTNVTVGAVLTEAMRQTGLVAKPLFGALFVGTPAALERIRSVPALRVPQNPELSKQLNQRMVEFSGCGSNLRDVVWSVERSSGIPIDLTFEEGAGPRRLFLYSNLRDMKYGDFLWWVSVLSEADVAVSDGRVKLIVRKPNH